MIEKLLASGDKRTEGESYQVFLLAPPDDADPRLLDAQVANDKKAESGRTWAWCMKHRYVRSDHLAKGPKTTGELDAMAGQS